VKKTLFIGSILAGLTSIASALPVEVDVTEPIAQVAATSSYILPYTLAVCGAGIVFGLVRRWLK